METQDDSRQALPSAFQEHLGTVAEFYARHNQELSPAQRAVERISFFLGSPGYVVGNLVFVVLWIAWNLAAPELGFDQWDEPPFFWLQGLIALNAFVISTTVLIRQNRMSTLASQHSHLDLQVNLLAEEKNSKIIRMLEELRRDLPNVRDKPDPRPTNWPGRPIPKPSCPSSRTRRSSSIASVNNLLRTVRKRSWSTGMAARAWINTNTHPFDVREVELC